MKTLASPLKTTLAALAALLLIVPAAPALGADLLMYGPSLAVWIQENLGLAETGQLPQNHVHGSSQEGLPDPTPFQFDESHFALDAGHTVTIVSARDWASMRTEEFAAFDALVIGDAGCNFDTSSELLAPVEITRSTWSPAVTGHLFLHTFDPTFHLNRNDSLGIETTPEQFRAMVDLSVGGMEFAASGGSTGLYYANDCRSLGDQDPPTDEGGVPATVEFLSHLMRVNQVADPVDGNAVAVVEDVHPAMLLLTDGALSNCENSYHAQFGPFSSFIEALARDAQDTEPRPETRAVILATRRPLSVTNQVLSGGLESDDRLALEVPVRTVR